MWPFYYSETGQGGIYPSLPPHEFSQCCVWLSVVRLRAGAASFSIATATKTLGRKLCTWQDGLRCSNCLAWIDNQVRREAGKKTIFINEGKSNFSVSIKPAVC